MKKRKVKAEPVRQKPSKKMPWKACGESARLVILAEGYDHPVCKRHAQEEVIKKMGLLYRKARAGETCGQSQNYERATLDMMEEMGQSGNTLVREGLPFFHCTHPCQRTRRLGFIWHPICKLRIVSLSGQRDSGRDGRAYVSSVRTNRSILCRRNFFRKLSRRALPCFRVPSVACMPSPIQFSGLDGRNPSSVSQSPVTLEPKLFTAIASSKVP